MAMLTINVNDRVPTHYCRVCGALWFKGADHWSLVSLHCGKCCDNALMGNQIVALEDPTGPEPGCQDCAREGRFLCDTHGHEPAKNGGELVKRVMDCQPLKSIGKGDRLYQILMSAGLPFDSIRGELEAALSEAPNGQCHSRDSCPWRRPIDARERSNCPYCKHG